ncbi:MAG: DUF5716 family protein [Defluviitaleaceae bacterium]|nr:DUF5716 family protein [Defluviitaleaceae bacterium]
MNWKKYREYFEKNRISEDHFVLGIDMGTATSAISYFDPVRRVAEVLDISGGYGKASAPTALQYIADTREWIFGEYAIMNVDGDDSQALMTNFVSKLGTGEYIDTGASARSVVDIAAIYLNELIENCRSINPKAQIAGIVATMPDFVSAEARNAMFSVYRAAGYDRVLIDLLSEREAILSHYFLEKGIMEDERLMLIDFGARGLRGSIYDVSSNTRNVKCVSAMMDDSLSTKAVDDAIYNLLTEHYCNNRKILFEKLTKAEHGQLSTFAHSHKDMLLGHSDSKPLRLYYNFAYPPFSATITQNDIENAFLRTNSQAVTSFVRNLAAKLNDGYKGINTVICTGGGFEMPWAKKCIMSMFDKKNLQFFKNSKTVLSQGATYVAATRLGLLPQIRFDIEDAHKMPYDIGIQISGDAKGRKNRFLPILERNSPLWQKPRPAYVILQGGELKIEIFKRDENGETARIGIAQLADFPERPKGTTKISIDIEAKTAENCVITIKDLGFGEIFPSSGISEEIEVNI